MHVHMHVHAACPVMWLSLLQGMHNLAKEIADLDWEKGKRHCHTIPVPFRSEYWRCTLNA